MLSGSLITELDSGIDVEKPLGPLISKLADELSREVASHWPDTLQERFELSSLTTVNGPSFGGVESIRCTLSITADDQFSSFKLMSITLNLISHQPNSAWDSEIEPS